MSETETCSKCAKPIRSNRKGSITQWINCCSCDSDKSDEISLAFDSIKLCLDCGKRVPSGRLGSFTQWIFRSDACSCDRMALGIVVAEGAVPQPARAEEDGQALTEEEELELDPAQFPTARYKPLKALGQGGSSTVYLCKDRLLGKRVAVKVLKTITADQLVRFQHEARATSRLNHPNIIRALDFGSTSGGAPFFVMDYVSGFSLEELIRENGPIAWSAVLPLFISICSALTHAHEKGIFHRDLKPSNILLSPVGASLDVRLIDFGVATVKHMHQEPTIVQGRTLVGTPAYMPPDQAAGLPYDARSEVYSLGCVIFETLTGRPPFIGATPLETISMHAHEQPPLVSDLAPDLGIPQSLNGLIDKCLIKDPELRVSNTKSLENALRLIRDGGSKRTQERAVLKSVPRARKEKSNATLRKVDSNDLIYFISALLVGAVLVLSGSTLYNLVVVPPKKPPPDKESQSNLREVYTCVPPETRENPDGSVEIYYANAESVRHIALRGNISRLLISGFGIEGAALEPLTRCSVKELILENVALHDEDIACLTNVKQLQALRLANCKFMEGSYLKFLRSPSLSRMEIDSCRLDKNALSNIGQLPSLRELYFVALQDVSSDVLNSLIDRPFDRIEVLERYRSKLDYHRVFQIMGPRIRSLCINSDRFVASSALEKNLESSTGDLTTYMREVAGLPNLTMLSLDLDYFNSAQYRLLSKNPTHCAQLGLNASEREIDYGSLLVTLSINPISSLELSGQFSSELLAMGLPKMDRLTRLVVEAAPVTSNMIKKLAKQHLQVLRLEPSIRMAGYSPDAHATEPTDERVFGQLKTLKSLTISSDFGCSRGELQQLLPACTITIVE